MSAAAEAVSGKVECPDCRRQTCQVFRDGGMHCFHPKCGFHSSGTNKRGDPVLPKRKKPKRTKRALAKFPDLPPPNASHPYLRSHRHKGDLSLRVIGEDVRQDGDSIVVAMRDPNGTIRNLQRIAPDGKKLNLKGCMKRGLFHRIGDGNTKRAWVVEGWATGVSVHTATGHDVYVSFGCDNLAAVADYLKSLGKHVCICGDVGDHSALMAEQVAGAIGGDLFIPRFPEDVPGTDANDLAQKLGVDELRRQIEKNTAPIPEPPDPIDIAAGMSRKEYMEFRESIAKVLGVSVRQLDKEVQERKQRLIFAEPAPWPEPVAGSELLESIKAILNRYVSLPNHAATAIALWIVLTYLVDEVFTVAILALLSPEKRCGKTTLLTVLARLVFRALQASNITPAAIYRMIDQHQPTLLVDEFDSFQNSNDELRGILNSGHSRDMAFVIRCVGDDNTPVQFSTFGAKVIAAIGKIAPTLEDRSIIIPMRRKLAEDRKKRLRRPADGDAFEVLRRQIARWVADNGKGLDKVYVRRPAGLNDRTYDNWLPLFQIAKRIGGDWLDVAKDAALALAAQEASQDESAGVLLLKDLQALFEREQDKLLGTAFVLSELAKMDDRPWPEYRRGEPITSQQLASLLKPFGIKPRQARRIGKGNPVRGYRRRDFEDAFARYTG
jgi:putative DNA primase/helicase